ncbi:uncharacterized protein METZ01_LOCUS391735, partial [marine metagenome]
MIGGTVGKGHDCQCGILVGGPGKGRPIAQNKIRNVPS